MVREHCRECSITLSEFEKEEYEELCVDCYREKNNEPKTKRTEASIRLKNKRYISHIVQG